jgi:(p)ppGpp synthase/HD superfamily hydrolase
MSATHNLLIRSTRSAHAAYDSINLKRKFSGAPYWIHTDEVRDILLEHGEDVSTEMLIAADHHDVAEDVTPVNKEFDFYYILKEFGASAARLVLELTDVFTKEAFPNMNRKIRKKNEAARLATISFEAKQIKLADLISNTADITKQDPGFAVLYLKEKEYILDLMELYDPRISQTKLFKMARKQIEKK